MLADAIPNARRILINVNNMDRLLAGGSVALATGTLAILFGMLSGPAASFLVWTFAIITMAAAAACIPWSWTRSRSRVPVRTGSDHPEP